MSETDTAPAADRQVPQPPAGSAPRRLAERLYRLSSLFGLLAVLVLAVVFSPQRHGEVLFLTGENLANVVRAVAEIGIIAVGMTLVVLAGGIDLSVGAVLGLAATGTAVLLVEDGLPIALAVAVVLLIGLALGVAQGFASAALRIQPFIVTLAGLQVARGLARIWSGGQGVAISYGEGPGQAPAVFALLGERTFYGLVPVPALIFAVVAGGAVLWLRLSAFARHLYAVGGNEKAARLAGVPVRRVKVTVFAVCGVLAALAGIVHAGQLNQGSPNDGLGYELDAIAAVVIGGTSLSGGRGSVAGTVAGALLLGVLNNVLALNGVDTNVQLLIKGFVIVAAAGLQRLRPGR